MTAASISVIIIISFLALIALFLHLIRVDKMLKRNSIVNNGLVYYIFKKPFYKIRNEFRNKIIWHKITGELTRFKYKDNYKLCKKYPFLKEYNVFTNAFSGYRFTWYDSIEPGWQKAFGQKLLDEIAAACGNNKKKMKMNIHFQQIKEKWGELRLYATATAEIQGILDKYSYLSRGYCMYCGKPAEYETQGYVSYLCADCLNEMYNNERYKYDEIKKDWKLTNLYKLKDFGHSRHCFSKSYLPEFLERCKKEKIVCHLVEEDKDGYTYEIDEKASYGVTVQELWGIKE